MTHIHYVADGEDDIILTLNGHTILDRPSYSRGRRGAWPVGGGRP